MSVWLHIVGVGDDGLDALTPAARAAIDNAQVLVGGDRHLAMLGEDDRERMTWPSPLSALIEQIQARRDRQVCVLATGDPCNFGIAVTLARHVPHEEMKIYPSPSAFALACARMGWDRNCVETLTVHGRPLQSLHAVLYPHAKVLLLSNDRSTPGAVAELLVDDGYGASRLTVLEHMGGERERVMSVRAADFDGTECADLNTIAIECVASPDTPHRSRMPGLADDAFEHDGQITKRVVRAATIAALAPLPGERLLDLGAGCGSVAIEWMRAHSRNEAIAIDKDAERAQMCARNAQRLGVPGLRIETRDIAAGLNDLPGADAVFIGGGVTVSGLFDACWEILRPGGRLVANTVTLEGEQVIHSWHRQHGGELLRINVSHAAAIGAFQAFRPALPVTQLIVMKAP